MAYWVDDGLDTSPEAVRAGTAAMGLYLLCGVWISRAISQGYITEPVVPAEVARRYGTREWAQRLVDVGLWSAEAAAGYRDVRYHTGGGRPGRTPELNPTAEKVAQKRKAGAERQARYRSKSKQNDGRRVTNASVTPSRDTSPTPPPSLPPLKGEGGRAPAPQGAARPPDPRRCRTCANRLDSPYHRNVCQFGPRTIDDPQETP